MFKNKDIFEKIKRGDKKAFELLFKTMYQGLCLYANKYIRDISLSEEIVQDVFFKIWMKRKQILIKQNVKSYIFTSVRNKCLLYIQRQKIERKYLAHALLNMQKHTNNVENQFQSSEIEEIVDKTLDSFPEKMRNIFIMSRFEGLKYQEIAKKLSISVKTVEANITKALKLFRENLNEYVQIHS